MERTKLLKRLYLLKKSPELYRDLSNEELADFVRIVLLQVEAICEEIKSGIHDGYSPQEGKDYIGRKEAESIFKAAFERARADFEKKVGEKHGAIEQIVRKRLAELRDGKDGETPLITDEMLWDVAFRAYQFIELPKFEALITQEPAAIRDALELLEGSERLSMSAIDGLEEALDVRIRQAEGRIGATVARRLGQIRDVNAEGATTGQVLTRQADGTYAFETPSGGPGGGVTVETPTGTVNGSNTSFGVSDEPKWIVADGIMYFDGAGYSYAAPNITMDVPPSQFIRAII